MPTSDQNNQSFPLFSDVVIDDSAWAHLKDGQMVEFKEYRRHHKAITGETLKGFRNPWDEAIEYESFLMTAKSSLDYEARHVAVQAEWDALTEAEQVAIRREIFKIHPNPICKTHKFWSPAL